MGRFGGSTRLSKLSDQMTFSWSSSKRWHILVDYRGRGHLDRLLAKLWTSRSIHPTISISRRGKMIGLVPELLPELTKNDAVDFFEHGED